MTSEVSQYLLFESTVLYLFRNLRVPVLNISKVIANPSQYRCTYLYI
jgi:hypothetical protein